MAFATDLDAAIVRLTKEFEEAAQDGIAPEECADFIFECAWTFGDLGKKYQDVPLGNKRRVIITTLRRLYQRYKPNIAGLPDMLEAPLHMAVSAYAIPALVKWVEKRV